MEQQHNVQADEARGGRMRPARAAGERQAQEKQHNVQADEARGGRMRPARAAGEREA